MKNIILVLVLFAAFEVEAQDFSELARSKVRPFGFLVGEWEGEGVLSQGPGTGEVTRVHEQVYFDLDSTVLIFRGVGKLLSGDKVHDAIGVLSFDPFTKSLKLNSWLSKGMQTQASVEWLGDGNFRWFFQAGPERTISYTLTVVDHVWQEQGSISMDKGETWTPFFEMKLKKVD